MGSLRRPAERLVATALAASLALACAAGLLACAARKPEQGAAAARVLVVTPAAASAPRQFRGAEDFVKDHASSKKWNAVHAILPDGKGAPGAVADFIEGAAKDPAVAAIVVAPAPEGTARGFRRAKELRAGSPIPLVCIAADSADDELEIESSADLVVGLDRVGRAYIAVWEAGKMGASSIVAAYSQGEASDPDALRERAVMAAAASELGLRYAAKVPPKGVDAAAFVRAGTGSWLRDEGPDVALYCSDPDLVGPLLSGAVAGGGLVAEAAGEATREAYAGALGVDLAVAKGDAVKEKRLLEKAAARLGLKGRLGLWDSGYGESSVRGLGEFALRVAAGKARRDDLAALTSAMDARSGGAAWLASYKTDEDTGVKSVNHVLVRQDVYVLGVGYLQSALQTVPPEALSGAKPSAK